MNRNRISPLISRSALILSVFLGLGITAKAGSVLTMTEVSSTILTYSWNGLHPASGTLTTATPDYWQFSIPDDVVTELGGTQNINVNWKEEDYATSGLVNWVNFFQYGPVANGTTITFTSDHLPAGNFEPGYPLIENGGTYTFNYSDVQAAMTIDNGDSGSVPDGGTTVGLLGMGLVGLASLRKRLARA